MFEQQHLAKLQFDRSVEQAILAIKKGGYLLKCRRRGKPKFCPFRLSTDEKYLIWYSGKEEKQLRLSSVTKIIRGQRTVNFRRQLQPDREEQSFSLIYANGESSLDLICKDKALADSWFVGLRAMISKCHHSRTFSGLGSARGIQSCVNSPAGYIRRKHNLGLLEDAIGFSQVHSVCGSPSQSLHERCFSDGLSYTSDSFYSSESSLSRMYTMTDLLAPNSTCSEPDVLKKWGVNHAGRELPKNPSQRFVASTYDSSRIEKNDTLKDVMIWGGVFGGNIGEVSNRYCHLNGMQTDVLLPKLLESTVMLDVQNISLGGKHAALVTKQGEVFCWGEGNGGKLGHKVNMDVSYPKLVESLNGIFVQSVACGEYRTCAVSRSGELYTWGDNNYGGGPLGEVRNRSHWLPCRVFGSSEGITVSTVACGEWHTAIVSTFGQLFTYGDGTFGVLGHGNLQSASQPKEIESLRGLRVKSVSCGPWHTASVVEIMDHYKYNGIGGKLFTWGDGDKGRLGHGDGQRKLLPTCVAQLVDHDFVQVSCGEMLTVALTSSGTVYTMGCLMHGQLGNPRAKDKSITVVEGKLKGEFVKEISSGSYHVAVLTSGGSVYTWGKGANGQLGLGDTEDRNIPTLVEALRDRLVESIVCHSSVTAAICLHKSISLTDQSTCRGCKMPFGFTRKKHNCYNCGLLFCHSCSSKKVINASLAQKKSKPSRVCDPCYNHLHKILDSGRLLKVENDSPRLLLTPKRTCVDEKEEKGKVTPTNGIRQSCLSESQAGEKKTLKDHGEKQLHLEPTSLSNETPLWGQVSSPVLAHFYRIAVPSIPGSKSQLSSVDPSSLLKFPQGSNSTLPKFLNVKKSLTESNKMLTQELETLKAEVRSLELECQLGSEKIQKCKRQTEETWLLAKEEAAKCKAAKEVIKALALRLHTMKEKISVGREVKNAPDTVHSPKVRPVDTDRFSLEHPMPVATHLSCEVKLPKERQLDSLSCSPIISSNKLKFMQWNEESCGNGRSADTPVVTSTELHQNRSKGSKLEWVEQYEAGVYVTLTILPSGQKGLKRVRFSRKRFMEKDAEQWWEENQAVVYQNYGIEGYTSSNHRQLMS